MRYPRGYVPDHAKFALRVDEYSSAEDDTPSETERYMTTPEPGAPEPALGLATAGPGASCGGGFDTGDEQGTFGYGVGIASSDTANEDEGEVMSPSPSSSSSSSSPSSSSPSSVPSSSSSPSPSDDEDGDINMTFADAAEENGNDQHEGHAGSVASGQTSVMEIGSDDEDMDIDENGDVQGTHTNRGNFERWLDGTYAVGYGAPRNAQEEMQRFDRNFGVFGL